MTSIALIVASQAVLAGLLATTSLLDRPGGFRRQPKGRPRDPVTTVRAHQQGIASLRAASERSQLEA